MERWAPVAPMAEMDMDDEIVEMELDIDNGVIGIKDYLNTIFARSLLIRDNTCADEGLHHELSICLLSLRKSSKT